DLQQPVVQAQRLPKARPFATDVERAVAIEEPRARLAGDDTAEAEVAFQWRDPGRGRIVGGCGLSGVCRVGHSLSPSRRMSVTLCAGRHSTQGVVRTNAAP